MDEMTIDPRDAEIAALRGHVKSILRFTWVPCDQTIVCPACGVAWWEGETGDDCGSFEDDWHEPGCAMQAILVALGASTGQRKSVGVKAQDAYGRIDFTKSRTEVAALREQVRVLRKALGPFAFDPGTGWSLVFSHGDPHIETARAALAATEAKS